MLSFTNDVAKKALEVASGVHNSTSNPSSFGAKSDLMQIIYD